MTGTYGSLRSTTPGITAAAVSGGSLSSGSTIYLSFQARNRAGRNLLTTPAAVTFSAGQRIAVTFGTTSRADGEEIYEYVISGATTNSTSAMRRLAVWKARNSVTINTTVYPNQGTYKSLPATFYLSQDAHIKTQIADITVASSAALPTGSSLVDGMIRYVTADSRYVAYDANATSGLHAASPSGYWVLSAESLWLSNLSSTDAAGGCDRPLLNLLDSELINVFQQPPYLPNGQEQEVPAVYWFNNGLTEDGGAVVESGTRLAFQIRADGINRSTAFDGRAIARVLGLVRRSDGSINTSISGVGADIILKAEGENSNAALTTIECPVDIPRGYALAVEFALQFKGSDLIGKGIIDGAQVAAILYELGRLGVANDAVWRLTGDLIFPEGDRCRVVPKLGGGFRVLGGNGIIARYPLPENLSSREYAGLTANTAGQRITLSGALGGDAAIRQPGETILSSEAVRAIASTEGGTYTASSWSSAVSVSSGQVLTVTVDHPCDGDGLGTIRSNYPDTVLQGNNKGDFNVPYMRVFVRRNSGSIQEVSQVAVVPGDTQSFTISTLSGATTVGSLPTAPTSNFCLFAYQGISAIAATSTSALTAGSYEVAVAYHYPTTGTEITKLSHATTDGCISEGSGTIIDAINSPRYWAPPVADADALRAIAVSALENGQSRVKLDSNTVYRYFSGSTAVDDASDNSSAIRPDDIGSGSPGRWLVDESSQILSGSGAPSGSLGFIYDFYIDSSNGDIYSKTGTSTWTLISNFRGSKVYFGTAAPSGSTGVVGDLFYILGSSTVADNGKIYQKTGTSTWTLQGSIQGPQGVAGSVSAASSLILNYATLPTTTSSQGALFVDNADGKVKFRGASNANEQSLALLGSFQVFTRAQIVAPVTLTPATTVAIDAQLSNTFKITLNQDVTLSNPTNLIDGGAYRFFVYQNSTGGYTVTFGSKFRFASDITPAVASGASKLTIIDSVSDGVNLYCSVREPFTVA